ncbi:hypothetical protein B0H16DRAFT_1478356 [Mycena metata]|uniref:Uncharacterized protein n=1 Tax=Mycena metata TaxID=1033252 RepID=A0AAD7H7H9_9AGAR|nr:hypothetical protein B0H16DRAFT_1478356 [Mycena metata]
MSGKLVVGGKTTLTGWELTKDEFDLTPDKSSIRLDINSFPFSKYSVDPKLIARFPQDFEDTLSEQNIVEVRSEPVPPDKSFNFDSVLSSKDFVDSKLISTFPQGFEDKISGQNIVETCAEQYSVDTKLIPLLPQDFKDELSRQNIIETLAEPDFEDEIKVPPSVEVRFASLIAFGLWAGFLLKPSFSAQHGTNLFYHSTSHIPLILPPQLLYLLSYSQISSTSQQLRHHIFYAQAIRMYISNIISFTLRTANAKSSTVSGISDYAGD